MKVEGNGSGDLIPSRPSNSEYLVGQNESASLTGWDVKMMSDYNMDFQQGMLSSSFYNPHLVSFQLGTTNSSSMVMNSSSELDNTSGMIWAGRPGPVSVNCTSGISLAGIPSDLSNMVAMAPTGSSSGSLLDTVQGFRHDMGSAADWTFQEHLTLEHGLLEYADEPNIMKYIKIAAKLPEKTVRDVVLRCQWMSNKDTGKRHKQEEYYNLKKMKEKKEKTGNCSLKCNVASCQPANMASNSSMMPDMTRTNHFSYEVPAIDSATCHLMDENARLFSLIADNLETFKLHKNINIFCHARSNILSILNRMSKMPGIMSHMPPLPVAINEGLANTILPDTKPQATMLSAHGGNQLKQEPRC